MNFASLSKNLQRIPDRVLLYSILRILLREHYFLTGDWRVALLLRLHSWCSVALGNKDALVSGEKVVDRAVAAFMKAVPLDKRKEPQLRL